MKDRRRPIELLTPEEARLLLATRARSRGSAGVRDTALLVLLYRGGLRLAEALALRETDVALGTGDVTVQRGKGGKRRTVRLDAGSVALIERWVARRRRLGIGPRRSLVCTITDGRGCRRGEPLGQAQVRHMLRRLATRAGVEKRVHAHGLRHTFAAELMREGVPIETVRVALGHTSLQTTQVYLQAIQPEEHLARLAARSPFTL